MAKKNRLIVQQKTSRLKRHASPSPEVVAARADQIAPLPESCPIAGIGVLAEETESLNTIKEGYHLLQAILQSTSDGILAVNRDNEALFANERFAEMWKIPQEIMASKDDALLLQYVLDQLSDPQGFLQKVQELYCSSQESFDTLYFKDGRVFERRSRPILQETKVQGRVWSFRDITERKRVGEALVKEQNDMQAIMNYLPVKIYFKDLASRFIRINKSQTRLFGLSDPEQAIGKTDFDFFTKEHAQQAYEDEQTIIQTGQTLIKEERETWADHVATWVSTIKMPLRDNEGNIIGTFGISTDITERKQAEEALAQERNLLRSLIDHVPDYIYVKDTQGRFLTANPAVVRLLAVATPYELLGKTDFDFFPQELAAKYYSDEQAIFQSGQPVLEQEEPSVDTAGNERWVSTTKVPLRNSQGKIIGLVGMGRDITEHKRATEELEKERNLLLTLINNLPDVIYAKDIQGRKIISNTADWQASGGKRMEDVLGKTDFDAYPPELAARFWADDKMVMDSGTPIINREEPSLDLKGNPIWTLTTKAPLRNDNGQIMGLVGIGRNITERKQADEELHRAKDDLETTLLKLQKSLEREKLLANTDGLTGLCNHRHFFELATREFQAAVRYQHPLAFVMFDLDYFKQINDTLGHTAGDKLLAEVAQIAASQVRASDLIARYGGDEFIVLLPYASAQQALAVAERIRAGVAAIPVDVFRNDKEPFTITLSIGIAEMRHEPADDNVERIIQRADDALYEAKRSGRNRTVVFGKGEV